jgi:hypothetical protein
LVVLTGLFFLSLAVPRGWHEEAGPTTSETQRLLMRQRAASREKRSVPQVIIVRPAEPNSGELAMTVPPDVPWRPASRGST